MASLLFEEEARLKESPPPPPKTKQTKTLESAMTAVFGDSASLGNEASSSAFQAPHGLIDGGPGDVSGILSAKPFSGFQPGRE